MSDTDVTFTNRRMAKTKARPQRELFSGDPQVKPESFDKARKAAPGYDIQGLFHEWISWWRDSGSPALQSADAAFISFCRRRHERAPL